MFWTMRLLTILTNNHKWPKIYLVSCCNSLTLWLKSIFYKKIPKSFCGGKKLEKLPHWNRAETGVNSWNFFASTRIFVYFLIENRLYLCGHDRHVESCIFEWHRETERYCRKYTFPKEGWQKWAGTSPNLRARTKNFL